MRSTFTDSLAASLNVAFIKSGMTVKQFIQYIEKNRAPFQITENGFFVIVRNRVIQFYFAEGAWYCKQ